MKKRVLVLGCTGSIGTSTLDIIREFPDRFEAAGLTAHTAAGKLKALAAEFKCPALLTGPATEAETEHFIRSSGADVAVNGIAGSAGLKPSVMVLNAGIDLALANKETIVMAGPLVTRLAEENGCALLPVDSEHSAIFNLIRHYGADSVSEIILTASGGPFRCVPADELSSVTAAQALRHPTWDMGQKITIDSATLANKGLEVIEACRLFGFPPERVKVTVHPQSLVHSLVKTNDGVLYAQISHPDMRHPILSALTWPETVPNSLEPFDITCLNAGADGKEITMTFAAPRLNDFPMLPLAYEAAAKGGSYTIAYNAANEVAALAFLQGKAAFRDIDRITARVMQKDWSTPPVTIADVFLFDSQARSYAEQLLTASGGSD